MEGIPLWFMLFGPNLLFVLLGAYFTDALNPAGLTANIESWSLTGYSLIVPGIFGMVWMFVKIFDGLVDIPLASLTDNIRTLVMCASPIMLTMLTPLFLIKEGEKYGEGKDYLPNAKIPLKTSLKMTSKNRHFLRWLIPNSCAFFGLQMFLSSQNTLISGVMNIDAGLLFMKFLTKYYCSLIIYMLKYIHKSKGDLGYDYSYFVISSWVCFAN